MAQQQMQAMQQEMQQMSNMLQNVQHSVEMREVEIKEFDAKVRAYQAETQRISAVQAGLDENQVQDIVMGTLAGMITSGDLVSEMPGQELPEMGQEMPEQAPMMAQSTEGMQ